MLIRLPGREERLNEAPYTRSARLVQDAARALLPYLDRPFAFFGHSMGAMISFELARELRRHKWPMPSHLLVSGHPAPQTESERRLVYLWPEAELIRELRRLNGTPPELFIYPELVQLMLPIVRADFEVVQTYTYAPEPPLECPITAFGGMTDDDVSLNDLGAWKMQTLCDFAMHLFRGDHFFINTSQAALLRVLGREFELIVNANS
jgi:medium-chain acyl-[acyl-carrier-protein] hydrolase